jgi:hypothetical protein
MLTLLHCLKLPSKQNTANSTWYWRNVGYWHPANLIAGWTPQAVTLSTSHDSDRLSEPVLVDLLSGHVYRLDGQTAFSVPLLDYPLLLTEHMVMVEGARHPSQAEP